MRCATFGSVYGKKYLLFGAMLVIVLVLVIPVFAGNIQSAPQQDGMPPLSGVLPRPFGVVAQYNTRGAVDIFWKISKQKRYKGFVLYRSSKKGVLGERIASVSRPKTSYFDGTGYQRNTTYFYTVRTTDGIRESKNSNQAEFSFDTINAGISQTQDLRLSPVPLAPGNPSPGISSLLSTKSIDEDFQNFLANTSPNDNTSTIIFAVNDDFAAFDTEWKKHAGELVEKINEIYARNTNKQFAVAQYVTYPKETPWEALIKDSSYHLPNGDHGLTIFFFGERGSQGGKQISQRNVIDHIPYCNAFTRSGLLDTNEQLLSLTAHEVGHCFGLGYPENYDYNMGDKTFEDPKLEVYYFDYRHPHDPMGDQAASPMAFSDLNAFIINHDLNQRWHSMDVAKFVTRKAMVRVKDTGGNVVPNAEVRVYAGKALCNEACGSKLYGQDEQGENILLETLTTNVQGEAEIQLPVHPQQLVRSSLTPFPTINYIGKIIKVRKQNGDGSVVKGGGYVTDFDVEATKILHQQDVHYVNIVIQ